MTRHSASRSARVWTEFTLVIGARVYRAMLLTLVAIAVAPALISWHSYVIKSGSMQPSIAIGDVAVGRDYKTDEKIDVGRVYMFQDPTTTDEHILVHRIVERRNEGDFTTRGDANPTPDTTPIDPTHIQSRAILLVPYVGLPIVWLQTGQFVPLVLWLLLTTAAFFLATRNIEGEPPKWTMRRLLREKLRRTPKTDTKERVLTRGAHIAPGVRNAHPSLRLRGARRTHGARGVRAVVATLIICIAGTTALGSANATFTSSTRNPDNTFATGNWLLPYVAAVNADNPRGFWLLDETSGTNVRDYSNTYPDGSTRDGTVQRGLPGAHTPRNPGTSFGFNGGQAVLHPNTMRVSNTHTVELWFRTTSKDEGYLIGFESTPFFTRIYDRTVLMDDGKIVVGNWTIYGRNTVTTPNRYNDGNWHHLVVTMAPGPIFRGPTSTIYIDGTQVAQGETSSVSTLSSSQWQIGKGHRVGGNAFFSYPVEITFRGDIDAVSIFDKALTPARVKAHWDAR